MSFRSSMRLLLAISVAAILCVLLASCGGGSTPGPIASSGKLVDVAGALGGNSKPAPAPIDGAGGVSTAGKPAGKSGGGGGHGGGGGGSTGTPIVLDGPAQTSSVAQGKYDWFTCTLPNDGLLYVVTLQPLAASEDSDLYVYKPTSAGGGLVGSSTRGHSGDTIATPDWLAFECYTAGDWRFGVYGYSRTRKGNLNDFSIEADRVRLLPQNGTILTDSVAAANSRWFSFEVMPTHSYTVSLTCASGDADLYVYGATSDKLLGQSTNSGGDDTVKVPYGNSGRVYVRVYGASAANFSISALYFDPLRATKYEYVRCFSSEGPNGDGLYDSNMLALDGHGNLFINDCNQGANERIEKFTVVGQFLTTWGTLGNGPGQFRDAWGIAVDPSGYVYVADYFNHRIQKFTGDGQFVLQWGSAGTGDGQFLNPAGVAIGPQGDVFVVDNQANRVQRFTNTGQLVLKWGSEGVYGDGQFENPVGIAADPFGNIYVMDDGNHRVEKFTSAGDFIMQWGRWDDSGAQFWFRTGIATDLEGNVYTSSDTYKVIQKWTPAGKLVATWNTDTPDVPAGSLPGGIAVDALGDVYMADAVGQVVKVWRPVE